MAAIYLEVFSEGTGDLNNEIAPPSFFSNNEYILLGILLQRG